MHNSQQSKSLLQILFITDIHLNLDYIQKLKKWHHKHQLKFNLCLIGGDTANCKHVTKIHNQQEQQHKSNHLLKQIQQFFNCKMIFIPGNHDPLNYFNPSYKISQHIQNCHQKTILIGQNLQLIGYGGSVPSYLDIQKTKKLWKGYPYFCNQTLTKDMQQKQIFTPQSKGKNQRIYFTHCGPFNSQTAIDRITNPHQVIYGGAQCYNDFVHHENLLMYIHGHVHKASKYEKINQVPLINPGGFKYGKFGYIVLRKDQESKKWQHQSHHFVQL